MIQIEKGNIEKNKVEITVTVEQEKVNQEFNNTYRELSQKIKIPGFRSGRIPANILDMNLGKEYIEQQVSEKLVKNSYTEAIDESKFDPIDVPKIDLVQIDKDKPFVYKMILELKPEIEIPELNDLTIEKKMPMVSDQDVDEELERIRDNHAVLRSVEDRESRIGDFLIIDYKTLVNGKPASGEKKENQMIQLGERVPAEFNQNLVGLKPGDEKEFSFNLPKKQKKESDIDEMITYQIHLSEIKQKELPALDDDFAKSVGEYKDLAELKEHVRKQLFEREKYQSESDFHEALMEKVAERSQFEVPEVLVEKQLDRMMDHLKEDLKNSNMSLEDYYKAIKADEAKVRAEYRILAEKQMKNELILDKIIQSDTITATDEEVKQKIDEIAESTNQSALKVKAMFEKNDTLDNLKEQIKREKAMEYLSRKIKIDEK